MLIKRISYIFLTAVFVVGIFTVNSAKVWAACVPVGSCSDYDCSTKVGGCEPATCCFKQGTCAGGIRWCASTTFLNGGCEGTIYCCTGADRPSECPSCFTANTPISTPSGQTAIKDLKVGDKVVSVDEKTDKQTESMVEKIYEATREAYYKIKLKNGKQVEVTAEHPLYAIQAEDKPLTFWEYLKSDSLTKKAIDYLFAKISP